MPIRNQLYWAPGPMGTLSPTLLSDIGPVLQVEVHVPNRLALLLQAQGQPLPAPVTGWALLDTGASRTAVHREIAQRLGVNTVGTATGGTAGGQVTHQLYPFRLAFPAIGWDVEFSAAAGVDLTGQVVHGQQVVALVGRDILGGCVFAYNGPGGLFTLSW